MKGSHSYHQGLDVLLESLIVEALEGLLVVKLAGKRVAGRVVLAEDVEPQLLGPPVTVLELSCQHTVPGYKCMLCRCRSFLFDTAHRECDAVGDM
jgi:hypothetical protein